MRRLFTFIAFVAAAITVYGQGTPQGIIDVVPNLPTPQQWAAGDTADFKARMAELDGRLSMQMSAQVPNVSANDISQAMSTQMQRQQEANRMMKENLGIDVQQMALSGASEKDFMAAMGGMIAQVQAQAMGQIAQFGLNEDDLRKIENMSDTEAEAYIKRRMQEQGKSIPAGAMTMNAEEREDEEQSRKLEAALAAIDLWTETSPKTADSIAVAEKAALDKLTALRPKRDEFFRLGSELANARELNASSTDIDALSARIGVLEAEYRADAYAVWSEFIRAAQGHLKALMPLAMAADEGQKTVAGQASTGSVAIDRMQGMSLKAAGVAMQYLQITNSDPEI